MQSCTVQKDPVNAPFREAIDRIFPPSNAPTNLESGSAVVSRDRAKFIQGTEIREGEHLSIWLREAADQPPLARLSRQPSGDPITKVQRDSLSDIGLRWGKLLRPGVM
jgi:hypothetical protein